MEKTEISYSGIDSFFFRFLGVDRNVEVGSLCHSLTETPKSTWMRGEPIHLVADNWIQVSFDTRIL